MAIDRRKFCFGMASAATMPEDSAFAAGSGPTIIAANIQSRTGEHAAVLYNLEQGLLYKVELPARGHDVTLSPASGRLVAFARRPGNFAVAFDVQNERPPQAFKTPPGRHFNGHGAFSPDGKLLFSTENDFVNATGVIGVWSVGANFKRIGEFRSYGVGPHDINILRDGRTLVIATHPDSGRRALNLSNMQPSLT